jgi:hypothetical protein
VGGVHTLWIHDRHNAAFLKLILSLYEAEIPGIGLMINFDDADANA